MYPHVRQFETRWRRYRSAGEKAAPAGPPSEIIDKLNAATNAFLKSPKGQETLANLSMQAVGGSPADLKAFIASELQKWGPVVKEANIAM